MKNVVSFPELALTMLLPILLWLGGECFGSSNVSVSLARLKFAIFASTLLPQNWP